MFAREHVSLGLFSICVGCPTAQSTAESDWQGSQARSVNFTIFPIRYLSSAGLVHRVSRLSCGLSRFLNVSRVAASSASPQLQRTDTVLACRTAACGRPRRQHRYRSRAVSSRPQAAVASTANGPESGCGGRVTCARFRKPHGIRSTCVPIFASCIVESTTHSTEHQVQYFVRTNNQ